MLSASQASLRRLCRCAHAAARTSVSLRLRHKYTMALAREIPDSFVDAVAAHSADRASAVSLALAREQHAEYLSQLRKHVPTLCLPAIEAHPDCVFVEDTVVGVGDTAVITQPGHA